MLQRSKNPTATDIRGLNEGADWQYGRALARAWNGHVQDAEAHFDSATSQARTQGLEELHNRLAIHRLILKCRCEMRPDRRHQLAQALIARLRVLDSIEDYRPPFQRVAGKWLAETLERDLEDPEFLLQSLEVEQTDVTRGLRLGDMLVARLV